MGGCRCCFRSCRNSSDSRTHFFHFPVRDKERCQKWLEEARRLEYNKLSITQLKNKVVCENHFADKCFMNVNHERLVHNAIPTEEGPYSKESNAEQPTNGRKCAVIPPSTSEDSNVATSDISSTTFTVSESPVLGLAFYSEGDDVKKSRNIQPYTEVLTRKSTGMVEILKRKLLETSQKTKHGKKVNTSNALQRSSNRNTSKVNSSVKENITEKINEKECIAKYKNQTKHSTTEKLELATDKAAEIENHKIAEQNQYTCELLPDVIVIPIEPDSKLLVNDQLNDVNSTISYQPSTIILNTDGGITTVPHSNGIKSNQKITVLETKTLTQPYIPPPNNIMTNQVDTDGLLTIPDNMLRMIERNSREIIELKNLVTQKQANSERNQHNKDTRIRRRKPLTHREVYVKKLELYSNIVQYLSPKTARLVYKELFGRYNM